MPIEMRASLFILLVSGCLILSGCTFGPHYTRPKVPVQNNFGAPNQPANTNAPVEDWWKTFKDPELDKLIDGALRENYTLQIATARIRQSRAQRNIAAANLFPQVDADAGAAISRGSKNVKLSLGGSGSSSSGKGSAGSSSSPFGAAKTKAMPQQTESGSSSGDSGDNNAFDDQLSPLGKGGLPGSTTELYQAGFDASWEIDVFGGKRRQVEAANAELQAANENRHDLIVTLLAEVARNYLELRGTQQRLQIANTNLADDEEIVDLTRSKKKSGLSNDLDVMRAAAQAAATAATIPPLQANERRLIHALSILLAKEPDALGAELQIVQPLPPTPPEVPVGLPSQLIERRPDIRQAEREIAAANARIGSAKADLFPKFALVATAGIDSSTPDSLIDWGSRYFLISPTVTWRIFDAGRILSNIELQKANEQESVWQYRNIILTALQEVQDALVAYATEQVRRNSLIEEEHHDNQSLHLARQQYDHGLVSFLDVLDAERTLLMAQDELEQSNQVIATDLVALYKALGGGWK
jgi:NodT family efflux transporter outer membrane factor (OMF) lipoprotein